VGILDHTGLALGGGQLVLAHMAAALAAQHEVEILHFGAEPILPRLTRAFSLELRGVRERRVERGEHGFGIPGPNGLRQQLKANHRELTGRYDLFIYSGHGVPPFCYARAGLVYCHFPIEVAPQRDLATNPQWQRRSRVERWLRLRLYRHFWHKRMRRYARVLTNSQFTAGWIERFWGCQAEVVYPPVELDPPRLAKHRQIISAGRFHGGPRSKGQLAQVKAFRQFLSEAGGGWRLLLAGSCTSESGDRAYLAEVRQAAEGLPVDFLVNVDRQGMVRVLAESSLFWHTTGLEVDEQQRPALAEHFGIVTVEAMRAGCVPVVIASGGQREIVEDGKSGFLVTDLGALVSKSAEVALRPELLARLA